MYTDGLVHDIDYFIDQFSPIEVSQQEFETEKSKGLYYFTGNLIINKNTEQIEYFYYSDDNFTQTYDHETIPIVRDGVSTTRVKEYYARSDSKTTVPTDWTLVPPDYSGKNKYLWNYEVTILSDGTEITTEPVVISENGKGIKSIIEYYATSNSNTSAPTTWSTTPLTVSASSKYLWNKEVITYNDDTTTETSPSVIGNYAADGKDGKDGKNGEDGLNGSDGKNGKDGKNGEDGNPAPEYIGPYTSAPSTRKDGSKLIIDDTYLNLTTKTTYKYKSNGWNALSSTDSSWWAALGDAINYASTSGQSVEAANLWAAKIVAGTILADEIMAKALTFKNIFKSENWNGGSDYNSGTEGIFMDHNGNAAFMGNTKIKGSINITGYCKSSDFEDNNYKKGWYLPEVNTINKKAFVSVCQFNEVCNVPGFPISQYDTHFNKYFSCGSYKSVGQVITMNSENERNSFLDNLYKYQHQWGTENNTVACRGYIYIKENITYRKINVIYYNSWIDETSGIKCVTFADESGDHDFWGDSIAEILNIQKARILLM